MDSNRSGRRRFLEQGAALAGLAVGAGSPTSAQEGGSAAREVKPKGPYPYGERSRFVTVGRTNDYSKSVFQGMFGARQKRETSPRPRSTSCAATLRYRTPILRNIAFSSTAWWIVL
jgi:hypothetical protein